MTGREDAPETPRPGSDAARPATVAALAIGWQVAELAAAVADGQVSTTSRVLVALPLVRTMGHRMRQLELHDWSGAVVSTNRVNELVAGSEVDRAEVQRAVLALNTATFEGLAMAGTARGTDLCCAYELGKALAQSSLVAVLAQQTGQTSLYRRRFDPARLFTIAEWLRALRGSLPEHAADAVFDSLRSWCGYVACASDEQLVTSGPALRSQSRIWRDLLFDRRPVAAPGAGRAQDAGAVTAPALDGPEAPALDGPEAPALDRAEAPALDRAEAPVLDGPEAFALDVPEAISLDAAFFPGGGDPVTATAGSRFFGASTVLPRNAVEVLAAAVAQREVVPYTDGAVVAVASPTSEAPGDRATATAPSASPLRDRVWPGRPWLHRLASWALVVAVALAITVLLRTFVVQPFSIPSGSMYPTLQVGDRILVDKLGPAVGTIHLGDIIVFRRVAADKVDPNTLDLVKRVVGLPGDTISSRGEEVILDGKPLAEPWLPALTGDCAESQLGIMRQRIPADSYFVLGDCRGISYDSRYWGCLPASHIVGKVFLVVWRHDHPWFHWF